MRPAKLFPGTAALALACLVAGAACRSTSTSVTAPSAEKCAVAASSSPASFGPAGGSGSISIQTARDCTWSVSANASWLTMGSASVGQGDAVVPYTVSANTAPAPRTASVTVGTEQIAVSQAPAPCTFQLSSTRDAIGAAGGPLNVGVSTLSGCGWTAVSTASWIAVASGSNGSGSAAVVLNVAANDGNARVGVVNIAGRTYTVAQDAAMSEPAPGDLPPPSPSPQVTVSGIVLTVAGRCPDLTLTIPGSVVVSNKDTKFQGGKCSNLKPGRSVTVEGTRGSNDVITADSVRFN